MQQTGTDQRSSSAPVQQSAFLNLSQLQTMLNEKLNLLILLVSSDVCDLCFVDSRDKEADAISGWTVYGNKPKGGDDRRILQCYNINAESRIKDFLCITPKKLVTRCWIRLPAYIHHNVSRDLSFRGGVDSLIGQCRLHFSLIICWISLASHPTSLSFLSFAFLVLLGLL